MGRGRRGGRGGIEPGTEGNRPTEAESQHGRRRFRGNRRDKTQRRYHHLPRLVCLLLHRFPGRIVHRSDSLTVSHVTVSCGTCRNKSKHVSKHATARIKTCYSIYQNKLQYVSKYAPACIQTSSSTCRNMFCHVSKMLQHVSIQSQARGQTLSNISHNVKQSY